MKIKKIVLQIVMLIGVAFAFNILDMFYLSGFNSSFLR